MPTLIKLKRGYESAVLPYIPDEGEPVIDLTNKLLYIGDGTGSKFKVGNYFDKSLVENGAYIELDGDEVSPGANMVYGTDSTGNKAWVQHRTYGIIWDVSGNEMMPPEDVDMWLLEGEDEMYLSESGIYSGEWEPGSDPITEVMPI